MKGSPSLPTITATPGASFAESSSPSQLLFDVSSRAHGSQNTNQQLHCTLQCTESDRNAHPTLEFAESGWRVRPFTVYCVCHIDSMSRLQGAVTDRQKMLPLLGSSYTLKELSRCPRLATGQCASLLLPKGQTNHTLPVSLAPLLVSVVVCMKFLLKYNLWHGFIVYICVCV